MFTDKLRHQLSFEQLNIKHVEFTHGTLSQVNFVSLKKVPFTETVKNSIKLQ